MRIIIGGALGRMGRELALAAEGAGAEVACGVDVAYAGQAAAFPIVTGFERIREGADVLIDFSRPDALPELLQAALTRRMPVVLCATGYTDVELSSIREAAQTLPVLRQHEPGRQRADRAGAHGRAHAGGLRRGNRGEAPPHEGRQPQRHRADAL